MHALQHDFLQAIQGISPLRILKDKASISFGRQWNKTKTIIDLGAQVWCGIQEGQQWLSLSP